MENVLISACLMGVHCRYDGKCQNIEGFDEKLTELMSKYNLIPVCPEILGGLSTPRIPAEILKESKAEDNSARALLGRRVINKEGADVTEAFERGADEVVHLAKLYNCRYAILKERSPSCGSGRIYDGTFSKTLTSGDGITADRLKEQGIEVFSELTCSRL